jgi:hypothetical protein
MSHLISNIEIELKDYLEKMITIRQAKTRPNYKYSCFEQLVLKQGKIMPAKQLPKTLKQGLAKYCYSNCQQLAFENSSLTYVEGYALHPDVGFPFAHAWLLDADGCAIDPTWETPGCYFGIPLSMVWVQSFLEERDRSDNLSILDGNYLEGFSFLRDGLPSGALAQVMRGI